MKPSIKEVIVVEGRDDTAAINRAVRAVTIETHGFGISAETWKRLEVAYRKYGLIIFTDPDHAGEEIRRRLKEKFPNSKEAFLTKERATKDSDIGIENAESEAIIKALENARGTIEEEKANTFSVKDLFDAGLMGDDLSKERRTKLGDYLGIGYSNGKSLLNKLNKLGITREEFLKAMEAISQGRE